MNTQHSRYLLILVVMALFLACGIADLTSQASPTAIPGWKQFQGGNVVLWLPESFEGGDIREDLDLILEGMEQLGPEFDQVAQLISQNPDVFLIYAFDINPTDINFITNVNVTVEQTLSAVQIEDYIEAALSQLPGLMTVVRTETLTINQYEAGLIELAYAIETIEIHQYLYVIKQGGSFYLVTYTTTEAEFAQRLPEFEQSISTFMILD